MSLWVESIISTFFDFWLEMWFYRAMPKIQRALISVSDKSGLVPFAKRLHRMGVHLISTGGTAQILKDNKIPVQEVSDVTGFPEMLNGRVKTLHPKIHAGILAQDFQHQEIKEYGIKPIDLVVVSLYPFEKTAQSAGVTEHDLIENIDVGGVALIRAAAKNFKRVTVVIDPLDYDVVVEEMTEHSGKTSEEFRKKMAAKAYLRTASYDAAIGAVFNTDSLPSQFALSLVQTDALRYGENPHERAAFYTKNGVSPIQQFQGKQLSYNNYLDIDAGAHLVAEFSEPACVIIKHTNPCGVGLDKESLLKAFLRAKECDATSYFGSIIVFNRQLTADIAREIVKDFIEVVVAPAVEQDAKDILVEKKNLRLIQLDIRENSKPSVDVRHVLNGFLVAEKIWTSKDEKREVVTTRKPTHAENEALEFVWRVAKHVKSNAIVTGTSNQTYGVGAGQMNRVLSVELAVKNLGVRKNVALASDAFFPFRDNIDLMAQYHVTAVIQPGGSLRDHEVIQACNEHGIAMVFTATRYFVH